VSDRTGKGVVMIEAFNIMQDRLTRMRLAGDPPDVYITPHIGHIVNGSNFSCAVVLNTFNESPCGTRPIP